MAPDLHHLGDVLVVEPQDLLVTLVHVLVIQRDLDGLALLEFNLSGTTLEQKKSLFRSKKKTRSSFPGDSLGPPRTYALDEPSSDFWSFGIQGDGHRSVFHRSRPKTLCCLTDILDGLSVVLLEEGQVETTELMCKLSTGLINEGVLPLYCCTVDALTRLFIAGLATSMPARQRSNLFWPSGFIRFFLVIFLKCDDWFYDF